MKYYVMNEAKNGLKLLLANLVKTNGEKWTYDIDKAYFFNNEEDAKSRLKYNHKVINEADAKKASCDNLALKIMGAA